MSGVQVNLAVETVIALGSTTMSTVTSASGLEVKDRLYVTVSSVSVMARRLPEVGVTSNPASSLSLRMMVMDESSRPS